MPDDCGAAPSNATRNAGLSSRNNCCTLPGDIESDRPVFESRVLSGMPHNGLPSLGNSRKNARPVGSATANRRRPNPSSDNSEARTGGGPVPSCAQASPRCSRVNATIATRITAAP